MSKLIDIKVIFGPKEYLDEKMEELEISQDSCEHLSKVIYEMNPKQITSSREIETMLIESSEYSSANEHVWINPSIFLKYFNLKKLILHNPPDILLERLKLGYSITQDNIYSYPYKPIDKKDLLEINNTYNEHILGQDMAKKRILAHLINKLEDDMPTVLLFYGASGIGKTETARFLAKTIQETEESLFRRQFSMFQTQLFADYLFGSSHSQRSFSKELLERQSNVILIDEFDKVSPVFHNAFYQMFDEGKFVDRNYTVDLKNTIIICTSNYTSEKDIREKLGDPMFSRFDACIKFEGLSTETKNKILTTLIEKELEKLPQDLLDSIDKDYVFKSATKFAINENNFRGLRSFIKEIIGMYKLEYLIKNE